MDSPYLYTDNGSTGRGSSRDIPIVVTKPNGYSATTGTVRPDPKKALWFKLALFAGEWEIEKTGSENFFFAIFSAKGDVVRRSSVSSSEFFNVPDGVYYLAMCSEANSSGNLFAIDVETELYENTGFTITGIAQQQDNPVSISGLEPAKLWPRILWSPPPLPGQNFDGLRQFSGREFGTPSWRLTSGSLSDVVDEDIYAYGQYVKDDEGEEGGFGYFNRPIPDTENAFFSKYKASPAIIDIHFGGGSARRNGLMAVVGFGCRRDFEDFEDFEILNNFTDLKRTMTVELIDGAGNPLAWVRGGFGLTAGMGGEPKSIEQQKLSGGNIPGYLQIHLPYYAPAYRALTIIVTPDFDVLVGACHPEYVDTKANEYPDVHNPSSNIRHLGYKKIGQIPDGVRGVHGIRVTVNKYIGLQYLELRAPNLTAADINEGSYWGQKKFVAEDEFSLGQVLTSPDWYYTPV